MKTNRRRIWFSVCFLCTATYCSAQTYSSTLSISGTTDGGEIQGEVNVQISGDESCQDIYEEATTYLVPAGAGDEYQIGGVGGSFQSTDLGPPYYSTEASYTYGPGSYTFSAQFDGFAGDEGDGESCSVTGSTGSTTFLVSGPIGSLVALSLPSSSFREGSPVTVDVSVTGANYYNVGLNVTGTVVLFYGSTVLASSSLTATSGPNGAVTGSAVFSLPSAGIAPGTYQITAVYNGSSTLNSGSSSPGSVTITAPQVSTATALTLAPTTLTEGASATLTATVTPSVSGITPTGTVTFYSGTMNLGHASLNSSGVASIMLSTKGISPGTYPITANYGGDAYDYASASSAVKGTIQAVTTTALAANPTTIQPGATVDFTATVARSGATGTPTGTVSFELGGYAFGTSTLNSKGVATLSFPTTNLGAGSYSIDAVYAGDTLDATSTSTPVTITVR